MGRYKSRHGSSRGHTAWQHSPSNWAVIIGGLALLGAFVYIGVRTPTPDYDTRPQPAEALRARESLRLEASLLDDGRAHFYRYPTATGGEIRFFVLRTADGVIRAAFDACDACFRARQGFHQSKDKMICNTCSKAFRAVDISVTSARCSPLRLDRTIVGDQIVITPEAIEQGARYF